MKKKIFLIIALLLLASLVLVGCQSAEPEETEVPAAEDEQAEAPAEMETVTITIWDFVRRARHFHSINGRKA